MLPKHTIFTILIVLVSCAAAAQPAMLTIVDGEKKPFFLFVDGLQENEDPKIKVRVKNLQEGSHHLKVIYEDRSINGPQKRVELPVGQEILFEIKNYESGKRKWYGIAQTDKRDFNIRSSKRNPIDTLSQREEEVVKTKVDSIYEANRPKPEIEKAADTNLIESDTLIEDKKIELSEFNCTSPLHPKALNLLLAQTEDLPTEDEKLNTLKTFISKNCVSSIQTMELLQVLEFEVSKLEVATFAYPYVFDPKNYYLVEDVFEVEASITSLHNSLYEKKD